MAWDFSTEPEFQEKLDWARDFIDREVKPLDRSEEHTSELQSQSTISYAVFCLKKKKFTTQFPNYRKMLDHAQLSA